MMPFYYTLDQEELLTATSIAKILKQLKTKPSFNSGYLQRYFLKGLFHRNENDTETIFKDIHHIPHGCTLKQATQGIQVVRQKSLGEGDELSITHSAAIEQFNHLFSEAIAASFSNKGYLGVELSGGLDSSAVAAMARSHRPHDRIIAMTNGPPLAKHVPANASLEYLDKLYDELSYSQLASRHLQLDQVVINDHFHFHDIIEQYTEILGTFAEVTFPIFNHRCYETAQSMGVTSLVSGFGGDEMVSQHATL